MLKQNGGTCIFALLLFCTAPSFLWAADCPPLPIQERAQLQSIHDGDTLRLTDGRRVRLLSVNAPEVSHDGKNGQPFGETSRAAAVDFFKNSPNIHLSFENRRFDTYGRLLAHVYNNKGENLEAMLVEQGLAIAIAVPPDLFWADCLQEKTIVAQNQKRGLWSTNYWQAIPATRLETATAEFRNICGIVEKVDRQRDIWIELKGQLVLKITADDFSEFNRYEEAAMRTNSMNQWLGKTVSVSGWLTDRRQNDALMARGFKPWLMRVRTPYAITFVSDCK